MPARELSPAFLYVLTRTLSGATTPSPPFSAANPSQYLEHLEGHVSPALESLWQAEARTIKHPNITHTVLNEVIFIPKSPSRPKNDNPHIWHSRTLHPTMNNLHGPRLPPHNCLSQRLSSEFLGLQHPRPRHAMDADDARLRGENMLSGRGRVYRSLGLDD